MVIGIDASRALKPNRTGTETHNAEIIKHLVAIDKRDTFRLYAQKAPTGDMADLPPDANIDWRVLPFPRGWTLIRLSWEMVWRPPDVLFIPAHILPLLPPRHSVVMIHDLGFVHFPELYKWTDKIYHRFAVSWAKIFARHILTPSEYTRHDLHRKYGISLDRITAVPHGFDDKLFRPVRPNETSPLSQPYFFYLGRLERKKNIVRMLAAFLRFKQDTGLPHKFIFAGRPGYGYEAIKHAHNALGRYQKDAVFLGYAPDETVARYLRHAQALVFATLFEGFGIPVLQAFASGTPVIASNTTCLPEVAGQAALLVNPESIDEIAGAMTRLGQEPRFRKMLTAKGLARYPEFSWEKAARKTLAVLTRVGRQP